MRRPWLSTKLFRAALRVDDVEAIASGNRQRIARRAKNRIVGGLLARVGLLASAVAMKTYVAYLGCLFSWAAPG